jgi:hypothetical protein
MIKLGKLLSKNIAERAMYHENKLGTYLTVEKPSLCGCDGGAHTTACPTPSYYSRSMARICWGAAITREPAVSGRLLAF